MVLERILHCNSPSKASNFFHDYEYYYIESESLNKEDAIMAMNTESTHEPAAVISKKHKMDTNASSMTVLVNKEYPLSSDYRPEDLVIPDILFNFNYYNEKKLMRMEAADALEQLFQASDKAGLNLCAISGFRCYQRQQQIYNKNMGTKGYEHTNLFSAMPGCSEHQSGLAMDVSTASINYRLEEVFAGTPEGKWLSKNAHLYGFIIRYPKNKSKLTGYAYEPWHIRYVGASLAAYLFQQDLCLEEYYNYIPSSILLKDAAYGNNVDIDSPAPPAVQPAQNPNEGTDEQLPINTDEPIEPEEIILIPEPILNTAAPEASQD